MSFLRVSVCVTTTVCPKIVYSFSLQPKASQADFPMTIHHNRSNWCTIHAPASLEKIRHRPRSSEREAAMASSWAQQAYQSLTNFKIDEMWWFPMHTWFLSVYTWIFFLLFPIHLVNKTGNLTNKRVLFVSNHGVGGDPLHTMPCVSHICWCLYFYRHWQFILGSCYLQGYRDLPSRQNM